MKTRVLVKTKSDDLTFGYYDTQYDKIYDGTSKATELSVVGLYIIKNNGLVCTEDPQEIKDHLQTYRIIQGD
jgi:hypothetical protein